MPIPSARLLLPEVASADDKTTMDAAIATLSEFYASLRPHLAKRAETTPRLAGYLTAYDKVTQHEINSLTRMRLGQRYAFAEMLVLSGIGHEFIAFDELLDGDQDGEGPSVGDAAKELLDQIEKLKEKAREGGSWIPEIPVPGWVETVIRSIVALLG
jgi:hypothetical protein